MMWETPEKQSKKKKKLRIKKTKSIDISNIHTPRRRQKFRKKIQNPQLPQHIVSNVYFQAKIKGWQKKCYLYLGRLTREIKSHFNNENKMQYLSNPDHFRTKDLILQSKLSCDGHKLLSSDRSEKGGGNHQRCRK